MIVPALRFYKRFAEEYLRDNYELKIYTSEIFIRKGHAIVSIHDETWVIIEHEDFLGSVCAEIYNPMDIEIVMKAQALLSEMQLSRGLVDANFDIRKLIDDCLAKAGEEVKPKWKLEEFDPVYS